MSTKHTPAPWAFVQGGSGDNPTWNVRIGSSMVYLPGAFDMGVMDANARLIAAAPEMLAALSVLRRAISSSNYFATENALSMIDRAIANATGSAS